MSAKDDLLDERIERIRRQNEQIQKRHLEVEADKQYAAKINALVSTTTSDENRYPEETLNRRPSDSKYNGNVKEANHVNRYVIKDRSLSEPERNGCVQNKVNFERRLSERQDRRDGEESRGTRTRNDRDHEFDVQAEIQGRKNTGLNRPAKVYTFKEGDGPPPDPAYRFLADASRDTGRADRPQERDVRRNARGGGNGGGSSGRPQASRDTRRGGHNKVPARSQRDEDSRRRYEAWKAERDCIDRERIQRQRTADGHWRREWDHEKTEDEEVPVHMERQTSWNAYRNRRAEDRRAEERAENRASHQAGAAATTSRQGSNLPRNSPNFQRRAAPVQRSPEVSRRKSNDEVLNPVLLSDRNVTSDGKSFTVCIRNESSLPEPVHKVKVNMPNAAGTGRVGPRQILHPTYSTDVEEDKTGGISHIIKGLENLNFHKGSVNNSPMSQFSPTITFDMSSVKPPLPPNHSQGEKPKPKREGPTFKTTGARNRNKRPVWNDKKVMNRENKISESSKSSKQSESEGESWEDAASGNLKSSKPIESDGGDESWEDATTSGTESACEFTEDPGDVEEKNLAAVSGNTGGKSLEDVTTSEAEDACEVTEDFAEYDEEDVNCDVTSEGVNIDSGFHNVCENVLNGLSVEDGIPAHVNDKVDVITNDEAPDCKIKEIPSPNELQINNEVHDEDKKSAE